MLPYSASTNASRSSFFPYIYPRCIDYASLGDSAHVHLTIGSYSNPRQFTVGDSIDTDSIAGMDAVLSTEALLALQRHRVFSDTAARDPNTGNRLRVVPYGESSVVRLGNDERGNQGQTITYRYTVDSNQGDIVLLYYALVVQNASHTLSQQPHFNIAIQDSTGAVVDSQCCFVNLDASDDTAGWHRTHDSPQVMWKDWSVAGINVARYHGSTIGICLTATHCEGGLHYCYAYFTLHCDKRKARVLNMCDADDSVWLQAPPGFQYRWLTQWDTNTLGRGATLKLPPDGKLYRCICTSPTNMECIFTVSARPYAFHPVAQLEYSVDTCGRQALFYSTSYVAPDSSMQEAPVQQLENIWHCGSLSFQGDTLRLPLERNGNYHILLESRLAEGSLCTDSAEQELNVDFVKHKSIVGLHNVCMGDSIVLRASIVPFGNTTLLWNDGSSDNVLHYRPSQAGDTTFRLIVSDDYCVDTFSHSVSVWPVYNDTLLRDSCVAYTFGSSYADTLCFVSQSYLSQHDCDSQQVLMFRLHPSYHDTVEHVTCDLPYYEEDLVADSSGWYQLNHPTWQYQCDSVRHIAFKRHKLFCDTMHYEMYRGDVYNDHGLRLTEAGWYESMLQDKYGCDSTYIIEIIVIKLEFPNVVTANGDGINDIFDIYDLIRANMFDSTFLWVYDKWGHLVYQKENINSRADCWDPNNTQSPTDTYFYRFNAVSSDPKHRFEHKGCIEVLR